MEVQWGEDEKLEEFLEQRRTERCSLQAELTQKVSELVVHERMSQGEKARGTRENNKVKRRSTEEMKDKPNSLLEEDTVEMLECRSMSQEEMDQCWKKLTEKIEEEVLDKYKVDDSKREGYRGRGSTLEWRRVRKSRKYRTRKWEKYCWARIFALFKEYHLQRLQSKQEESTDGEEMKR